MFKNLKSSYVDLSRLTFILWKKRNTLIVYEFCSMDNSFMDRVTASTSFPDSFTAGNL